ncbi:hypothetical protein GCM10027265_45250 [Jatrophihabitans fulvus]
MRPPRPVTPASILAARLAELAGRAHALEDSPAWLREELDRLADLAGGLEPYLHRMTTPASDALRALEYGTTAVDWDARRSPLGLEQEMLSGHVEGRLLQVLVRATGARCVLEIGTFTGYATLAMAEAIGDGRVVTLEIDADVADQARAAFDRSGLGGRIEVRVGPALDTLCALADAGERFDLVFVDADKAGYADYVRTLLDTGLLAPRGLLCIDNTLMQGQPWAGPATPNGSAIAAFNEFLADEPRLQQVVVPLRDGVTLACRTETPA